MIKFSIPIFLHFRTQQVFLSYFGKFQSITNIRTNGFWTFVSENRPFTGSRHMVRNKLHWDTNEAVGLPKQRNFYQSTVTILCFESPSMFFASQCNLFRTMWLDPAKGLLTAAISFPCSKSWWEFEKMRKIPHGLKF